MTSVSAPLPPGAPTAAGQGTTRAQLTDAARQFEAIFVRQMLGAARKADFGTPLLSGQGLETFRTMQDEHFADIAAQCGTFGFAALIERHLAAQLGGGS